MLKTEIRNARQEDANAIVDVYFSSYQKSAPDRSAYRPALVDLWRELIALTNNLVYVATINGTLCGVVSVRPGTACSHALGEHIYVHKEFQSAGVGLELMMYAKKELSTLGIFKLEAFTPATNQAAQKLILSLDGHVTKAPHGWPKSTVKLIWQWD